MSSQLDTSLTLGLESTYGTPATLTDSFEGQGDSWKREMQYLDSVGFRAGDETLRSDRRVAINMGGAASMEMDVLNKGLGFLLQGMCGGGTQTPTQIGATAAYKQTHSSQAAASLASYTAQMQRVGADGALQSFTHHGATITGWSFSQEVDDFLKLSLDFDLEDVDTSTGDGTPAYPASASPFDWTQLVATINSVATDLTSMEFAADLKLKTDRRFLRGNELKKQPKRTGRPAYNGSVSAEFTDTTEYDLFVAGTIVPIVFTWTGAVIESPEVFELVITLPACQFTGEAPSSQVDGNDLPMQSLPFVVLDNGTDPAYTIEYTSTDTAL